MHRRVYRKRPKVNKVTQNPKDSVETVGYDHNDASLNVLYDRNDTTVTAGYSENSYDISLENLPDLPGQNGNDEHDENAIADDENSMNGVQFSEISDDDELT